MFSFHRLVQTALESSVRRSGSTDELIASMALGKSGCFQERIKFLSGEQQFVLDVPRRLFTYALCDVGWWYRVLPTTTGTRYKRNTMASEPEMIPSPDSQAPPVCTRR